MQSQRALAMEEMLTESGNTLADSAPNEAGVEGVG